MLYVTLMITLITSIVAVGAAFFVLATDKARGYRKRAGDLFCNIMLLGMWTCIVSGAVWNIWELISIK